MRTICERMRAVQGQPVSGQREEEKGKNHKGYRYSSSGYSPAVSPLSMQSLPMQKMQVQSLGREGPLEKEMAIYSRRRHLPPSVMGWGGGGEMTSQQTLWGLWNPVSILKSSPRLVGQSRINPETLLRVAVQVSS